MEDIIIIGAGAVGAFVARNLSRYRGNFLVLEKELDVGDATSMANSAIVHSGYDPVPGTKKAFFNVKGNAMYPKLCEELDIPFDMRGSITVAMYPEQLPMLEELARRGKENGVETKILSAEELKEIEPNISPSVQGGLLCPSAGIVDPFLLVAHTFENAIDNGVKISLGETVTRIEDKGDHFVVHTDKGIHEAKVVINCAGTHSEEISRMVEDVCWHVKGRKGEYFVLDHFQWDYVRHVLFPLPSEKGKGVLVTQTTSGNYLVGPSSEWIEDIDETSTDSLTLSNVKKAATEMVPGIPFREQIRVFSGVRATPDTHDFIIEHSKTNPNFIHVAGIESPGLVSSPAIGEYVVETLVKDVLELTHNPDYVPTIRKHIRVYDLSDEQRQALIEENPHYGEIICNCEKVALGEIEDVLSRSLPCLTIKAMKKRSRVGFGRCQGGFCQPKVLMLLAKALGKSPLDIRYDKEGSEILKEESK